MPMMVVMSHQIPVRALSIALAASFSLPLLAQEAADLIRATARQQGFTERQVFTVQGAYFDWAPVLAAAQAKGCPIQVGTDMLFEMIPAYLEFFGFGTTTPEELRSVAQISY